MKKDLAIVFMCGGISSRFGGRIKQFAKVGPLGETLIEYSMNQAIKAGFTKIVFIVGNMTEKPFREKFNDSFNEIPVEYALQKYDPETRDKPWGTVDAICTLKDIIDCPFVICNGDDIYGENTFKILANHLKQDKEEATIGYRLFDVIPETGKTNRGIYKIENGYIKDINEVFNIEKNNLSATNNTKDDLCSMNFFALHPKTIKLLNKILEKFKLDHKGDRRAECLLPVELSNLIKQDKIKMKVYKTIDPWFGVTNPEDEDIVRKMLIDLSKR